jgi:hypothetical protein
MVLARISVDGFRLLPRRPELARTLAALLTWFFQAARLCLAAGIAMNAAPARADDAPPKPARMENRFLFLIDTSSAMRSRTNGVEQAVTGLLKSDLQGQLRNGDTLGIWTYNDRLHTEFPMQVWSDKHKDSVAESIELHLSQLRYEKSARLEKVWPAVRQAAAKSERLTIFLIYDGEETLRGTPFDQDINDLQNQFRREFRAGHLPFVTVLTARDGKFADYTVNYPGSVNVPRTADPLPPPQTNPPPVVLAAPTNAAVPPAPPRRIEIVIKGTPPVVPPPAPAPVPPAAASNAVVAVAPAAAATTNEVAAAAPPISPPASSSTQPPPSAAPVGPAVRADTNLADAAPAPGISPPVVSAPVSPPMSVVAPAVAPAVAPVPPVSQTSRPAPVPAPMPVTIASAGQRAALFAIAVSLVIIAAAAVFFLVRRSRAQPQASLITQSIDRSR